MFRRSIGLLPVMSALVLAGLICHRKPAVEPGTVQWMLDEDFCTDCSPAIGSDGTIYFVSTDDCLYAVNADGSLRWRRAMEEDVNPTPALGVDGTIYLHAADSSLLAVNPDGTLRWRCQTGRGWSCPAPSVGSDGTIYVASDALYAVTPEGALARRAYRNLRNRVVALPSALTTTYTPAGR